jgi:hypothetical protein
MAVSSVFPSLVMAQKTEQSSSVFFKMASKTFSLQGSFEGEYRILPDSIELKIIKGNIFLVGNTPDKRSRMLDRLSFGLATMTEDGKRFQFVRTSQSRPLVINKVMRPSEEYPLENVYFSIPKDKMTDLSKVWIVATMAQEILESQEEIRKITGFSYAHSCQNIFTMENENAPCVSKY